MEAHRAAQRGRAAPPRGGVVRGRHEDRRRRGEDDLPGRQPGGLRHPGHDRRGLHRLPALPPGHVPRRHRHPGGDRPRRPQAWASATSSPWTWRRPSAGSTSLFGALGARGRRPHRRPGRGPHPGPGGPHPPAGPGPRPGPAGPGRPAGHARRPATPTAWLASRTLRRPRNTLTQIITRMVDDGPDRRRPLVRFFDDHVSATDRALGTHLAGALARRRLFGRPSPCRRRATDSAPPPADLRAGRRPACTRARAGDGRPAL